MKRPTIVSALLFLMLASSFALGSTAIVKTAQRDQPRVVSKEIRLSIGSQVLKGSNDEGVQLVLSRSHVRRLTNVTRGPADVNFTDSNSVHIEGELNNTQTIFLSVKLELSDKRIPMLKTSLWVKE
ncbi:MAG: hypothetical protein D6732_21885 [Methanobacteriota archaeon]|nr:MAG: hypothetical protein D6732_21885 [Euryarchaeota archaeon]